MPMILNEEQNMLKDSAKDFCTNSAPIEQLRKLRDENNADGFDRDTWKAMVELGWAGIPFPEEHGGLAFGYKGLGVVTEETGRTLAASPSVRLRLGGRHRHQRRRQQTSRSRRCCRRLPPVSCCWRWRWRNPIATTRTGLRPAPKRAVARWQVSGEKTFVLDGHVADKLIVVARTSPAKPATGTGSPCCWLMPGADGVEITRTLMADSRNASNVKLSNAVAEGVIGEPGKGADILDATLDIARIGLQRKCSAPPRSVSSAPCSI